MASTLLSCGMSGLSGNAEMLASFVRPKIADCQKILAEAGLQLGYIVRAFNVCIENFKGGKKRKPAIKGRIGN